MDNSDGCYWYQERRTGKELYSEALKQIINVQKVLRVLVKNARKTNLDITNG
jgi:hypothetical protein